MMEGHGLFDSADSAMIEAFMGPVLGFPNFESHEELANRGEAGQELNETALLRRLHSLVEETSGNWTYGIFWQLSSNSAGEM